MHGGGKTKKKKDRDSQSLGESMREMFCGVPMGVEMNIWQVRNNKDTCY